jgi:hypothetical protein
MYIEFMLPFDAAAQEMRIIHKELQTWHTKYLIPYTTKVSKYRLRVCFTQDEYYSFWAMTWRPREYSPKIMQYRIVTDLNNKI